MSVHKFTFITMLAAFLACATLFGQSVASVAPVQIFHAHGTVRVYPGDALPQAQVRFENEKFSKTVYTDKAGLFEANLPVGLYTMTVDPPMLGLKRYRRPLFQVESPTDLTLDAILLPGVSCSPVMPKGSDRIPNRDESQDACGGLDSFRVPSDDGVPFELFIDYPVRQRADRGNVYSSRDLPGLKIPVLVAYNLFTLRAERVVYDVQGRTLDATGKVVVERADGTTQSAESMALKIESGEATPLP
jgi:hypothetical protein